MIAGVSHIHTSRSDGTGTPDEVAEAASRAGLQFVVLTDHGDGSRQSDPPQYRHGILCLDAVEISTTGGHYIGIDMARAPYPLGGEARDVVEDVARLGGFGIVAHPDSPKSDLRWREWTAPFDAMEWLNADTEWRDESASRLARAMTTYALRPVETLVSLIERPDATLGRWDVLTQRRPVVGLSGNDAHAGIGLGREPGDPYRNRVLLRLPSYEMSFSAFSIRVELKRPLTGEARADAAVLLEALRGGRLYSVMAGLAGPPGFDFVARSGSRQARQGDSLEPEGPLSVAVRSNAPPGSSVALFRNGQMIAEQPGATLQHELPAARGVLRVEVRLNRGGGSPPVPWIVSNPIYVSPLAVPPQPRAIAEETTRLDEPGAERSWHIEHRSGSDGTLERAGDGPVAVRYGLRATTSEPQFVAVVLPEGARLKLFDRLSLRASADKPMRLSIQLRKPDGAQGQRWHRSIYVDQTPRDVTVPWNDMTPVGRTDTFRPDLARIEDLLFVVDTTNTAPGERGRFSIEDLRLER